MKRVHSSTTPIRLQIKGCPARVEFVQELGLYKGVFDDIPSVVFYAEAKADLASSGERSLQQRLLSKTLQTLERERWLE